MQKQILFSGTSNPKLAEALGRELKINLGKIDLKKFSDGETYINIKEEVGGREVLVLQSGSNPVNEHFMDLLLIIDALRRLKPQSITAIMPFYPYRRQERKVENGEPISAEVVAKLLEASGVSRIIALDIHHSKIMKFFKGKFINIEFSSLLVKYFKNLIKDDSWVVVSPDEGALEDSERFARQLRVPTILMKKSRDKGHDVIKKMCLAEGSGEVKDKNVVMIDDEINTAGTVVRCSNWLKEMGAKNIYMAATHAVLSGPALVRLKESSLKEIIFSDTIFLPKEKQLSNFKILSVAGLIAEHFH